MFRANVDLECANCQQLLDFKIQVERGKDLRIQVEACTKCNTLVDKLRKVFAEEEKNATL